MNDYIVSGFVVSTVMFIVLYIFGLLSILNAFSFVLGLFVGHAAMYLWRRYATT